MLLKTQGIVLSYLRYRETSIIVRVFTKEWGLQSYIVQRVRTKKPTYGIALFQPLTLLDLVVYKKKQGGLQHLSEVKCHRAHTTILSDMKKAAIAVFLAELLSKVVREEDPNEHLFSFAWQSVIHLDRQEKDYDLFYLHFLLQLGRYLGFAIGQAEDIYTELHQAGYHIVSSVEISAQIDDLIHGMPHGGSSMDKVARRSVTDAVIKFYQLHIEALGTLQSLKVLQAMQG